MIHFLEVISFPLHNNLSFTALLKILAKILATHIQHLTEMTNTLRFLFMMIILLLNFSKIYLHDCNKELLYIKKKKKLFTYCI